MESGGTSEGWTLDLDPSVVTQAIKIVADDDGTAGRFIECNETNNIWLVEELCP